MQTLKTSLIILSLVILKTNLLNAPSLANYVKIILDPLGNFVGLSTPTQDFHTPR